MVEDFPDPFDLLADTAGKVVADAWTTAMLNLWNGGLWLLRLVLRLLDGLLTPDLSPTGPGAAVYATTFWLAGVLVLVMFLLQLGVTAFRRDGKSLATALVGLAKFVIVWAAWLSYGALVVAACGGISRALMQTLLRVDAWAAWQPFQPLTVEDLSDGAVATVLGLLGLLVWLAAVGHLLVMVTRAGALIVLAALTPAAAAGLVADAGRPWFWKSLRWFHAAAFTPVLMVLMLGVGVQMTSGVAYGRAGSVQQAVGTALPGVLLILIACFAPLALFKLLAFVDPTTNSGAALRTGLAATGGLSGVLSRSSATSSGGGGGAADGGRPAGETASDEVTSSRFGQAQTALAARFGGTVGAAAAAGLDLSRRAASAAAAVGSDLSNQMGVGHASYHPHHEDYAAHGHGGGDRRHSRSNRDGSAPTGAGGAESPRDDEPANASADPATSRPVSAEAATPDPPPIDPSAGRRSTEPAGGSSAGSSPAGTVGAKGAAPAAEAAAAAPVVPV